MHNFPSCIHLSGNRCSLIIDVSARLPSVSYWGRKLSEHASCQMIDRLSTRQEAKCSAVEEPVITLTPTYGSGFIGSVGLEVFNQEQAWSINGDIADIAQEDDQTLFIKSFDNVRKLSIIHRINLDKNTDVVSISTEFINRSDTDTQLSWCAAATLPIPYNMTKIMSFEGRWAKEFQRQTVSRNLGSFVRENRRGKTSHDCFPGMVVHTEHTNENQGDCFGFHLGWSGNHKLVCEHLADGRGFVQMGELLLPGEITLATDESYKSPTLYACFAAQGFNEMSANFHQFVRENLLTEQVNSTPRPVHYNTWEGIYFDHDTETLADLAKQAAEVGAERFVLDDGWFKGRRGDFAGLGDWTVDKEIYPDGLQPLIDKVLSTGMTFGIWFEPEMVNPDSDLYRNHPDWVLGSSGNEQLTYRNQLVLDLTREAVTDYLYKCIDDILVEYPDISYIKWDINRDLNHAGGQQGRPAVHGQTKALYQLIDRLREKHPSVEIESCSSGGARVDYGVLSHTDRVWTSDSNDALDRLSIQRGCSYFFPAEVMGAHVGPRDCHTTGRRVSVEMRAAVAFFGHMGIEMDPRELTDHEREQLQAVIKLHKQHRELIHSGELVRLQHDENSVDFGIVNADKSEALYSYNVVTENLSYIPNRYLFNGLNPSSSYRLDLIWPTSVASVKQYSTSVLSEVNGQVFTGDLLIHHGMQMPILDPQSSLIFKLTKV